jgi:CO/xanthine dehydrogenase Mo-binding subunit
VLYENLQFPYRRGFLGRRFLLFGRLRELKLQRRGVRPGMTTALPLILAERLKISPDKVYMNLEVNTHHQPEHWKTVASMSTYMAGNAILTRRTTLSGS